MMPLTERVVGLWSPGMAGKYESATSLYWKYTWIKQTNLTGPRANDPKPPFEGPTGIRTLGRFARWLPRGAIGSFVRFCPACIRDGYVSTFFQLSVLERCPIHGESLREECDCGSRLPRFDLRDAKGRPFHCVKCDQPWGGSLNPHGFFIKVHHPEREGRFRPLLRWLLRLRSSPYNLGSLWRSEPETDGERLMLSMAMQAVQPYEQGVRSPLFFGDRALKVHPMKYVPAAEYGPWKGWRNDPDFDAAPVERAIRTRVLKGLELWRGHYSGAGLHLSMEAQRWVKPSGVHPLVHGYWRWRDQLEGFSMDNPANPGRSFFIDEKRPRPQKYGFNLQISAPDYRRTLWALYFEAVRCTLAANPKNAIAGSELLAWIDKTRFGVRFCGGYRKDNESQGMLVLTGSSVVTRAREWEYAPPAV